MATVDSLTAADARSRPGHNAALLCFVLFAILTATAYGHLLYRFLYWMLQDELTLDVTNRDFANYWMGGRLVLTGEQQQLFDWDTYFPLMREVFGIRYPIHNWGYPPHSLLLLWPLGYLEFRPALLVFLGVSFAMFAIAVMFFRREYAPHTNPWLLSAALLGYVLMMVDATQNGFLSAAAILFGLAMMRRHPAWAGLAFGLLTIKPQLGLLIPVLLLFDRNWRAIAWSVVFTALLVGASISCFGVESWHGYLTDTVTYQRYVMTEGDGIFLRMMPTLLGSLRSLDLSAEVAGILQGPVSVAATVLILWLLRRESDPLRRAFIVVCGTLVVTPYAFNYDMGALNVVAALLAISGTLRSRTEIWVISVVAVICGAVVNLGLSRVPVTPLILAAGLLVIAGSTLKRPQVTAEPVATPL